MRLTQPFRAWQLAVLLTGLFIPQIAYAGWYAHDVRIGALNGEFPRDVVYVSDGAAPLDEVDVAKAISKAIDNWNSVACSSAELRWAGVVESVDEVGANTTPILFVDAETDRCFAIGEDIGWTIHAPCSGSRGDYPPKTVLLNGTLYEWATSPSPYQTVSADEFPRVDILSVVTHELGHVLDLRHIHDDPLATMAPRYLRDGGLSTLSASDKLALCDTHPGPETSECKTDEECGTFRACRSNDTFDVCDEERAQPGQYCDLALLVCDCHVTSPTTYSGYCTAECSDDADCSDDMFCDSDAEECRLVATFAETGCSTGHGQPEDLAPWALLGLLISLRRRP